jgi:GNAT superfamily N-acetyltransferase
MIELEKEQRFKIKDLYRDAYDTTIWSYFQGYHGRAWCNNLEKPTCARILVGDFCFLTGEAKEAQIQEFLSHDLVGVDISKLIWIPQNNLWTQALCQMDNFEQHKRYALRKNKKQFCVEKLRTYKNQLPKQYDFRKIDHELYYKLLEEQWTKDFVLNYNKVEDFINHGIGYVILEENKVIAGASSYTHYDEGIEVEIATREEYRKQGLATIVGAKLILACLELDFYPNWDAANLYSLQVAKKLGYELDHEYPVFIHKNYIATV